MWEHFDIWLFLAGLGIFLFGIRLIEDSIEKLGGRGFKRLVREGTSTSLRAIFTGTAATALLQSSSAVTLMVLAFVGAGIVSLAGGIGVILGSNIGTTATSWIVATIGFKLDIEQMALPLIGIGGLILVFLGRSPRYSQVSHLLVGVGFLFLGLDHMKDSVSAFAEDFDASLLLDARPWMFIVLGILLTALMQSSSATVAVLLTALNAGVFDPHEGALAVIGSNVGTTITVFLGALGGSVVKKRLAWSHLAFNVFAGVIAVAALPLYMRLVDAMLGTNADPVMGLALFHTLFNIVGVIAIFPLIHRFGMLVEKLVPEKVERITRFIQHTSAEVPEAAVAGVEQEVRHLLKATITFHLELLEIEPALVIPGGPDSLKPATHEQQYEDLKMLQAEIMTFATQVERHEMNEPESITLNRVLHAARLALYSAKGLKDVKRNLNTFAESGGYHETFHMRLRRRMISSHGILAKVLSGEPDTDPTIELASLLKQLQREDTQGMQELSRAVRDGDLRNKDMSTALLVNRAVVRSTHDMALALSEVVLAPEEQRDLERVQEVEDAMEVRGIT